MDTAKPSGEKDPVLSILDMVGGTVEVVANTVGNVTETLMVEMAELGIKSAETVGATFDNLISDLTNTTGGSGNGGGGSVPQPAS